MKFWLSAKVSSCMCLVCVCVDTNKREEGENAQKMQFHQIEKGIQPKSNACT
ncbi:hypothetical protein HanRHA438_Chr05g0246141 [Helianthus annuus]|nr:hypothetical protein HanIR_Chr08g0343521 [Helianthus annuus]KAJ0920881.1 hypothetical protein HanRHA438_Chr05g0246141 [Helianthus annuus]